jgi:hypothetical protein
MNYVLLGIDGRPYGSDAKGQVGPSSRPISSVMRPFSTFRTVP